MGKNIKKKKRKPKKISSSGQVLKRLRGKKKVSNLGIY